MGRFRRCQALKANKERVIKEMLRRSGADGLPSRLQEGWVDEWCERSGWCGWCELLLWFWLLGGWLAGWLACFWRRWVDRQLESQWTVEMFYFDSTWALPDWAAVVDFEVDRQASALHILEFGYKKATWLVVRSLYWASIQTSGSEPQGDRLSNHRLGHHFFGGNPSKSMFNQPKWIDITLHFQTTPVSK